MTKAHEMPCLPIFDQLPLIKFQNCPAQYAAFAHEDFHQAKNFLLSYQANSATFNSYRREVERLLQWAWQIAQKSVRDLKRADIEGYISFCQNPPPAWIGLKKLPRFLDKKGQRVPHPDWRPFVATISKTAHQHGQRPSRTDYRLSSKSLREIFTITGVFYNFLIQEDYTTLNPVLHIRQKSRFLQHHQSKAKVRRLTELQWHYVIETAEIMADNSPVHERTLFIMTALYSLYLRISELAASKRWTPTMGDFYRDPDGLWWFSTVGKGNKARQIAVSDDLLKALRRYRIALGLSPLPLTGDATPLVAKQRGKGPMSSTSQIRIIVQACFDQASTRLRQDSFLDEADSLLAATVHWLRHTGISEDVKYRPREHVRDDAGHSSSVVTDRYIDIELRARHASSKKKRIKPEG